MKEKTIKIANVIFLEKNITYRKLKVLGLSDLEIKKYGIKIPKKRETKIRDFEAKK